MNYFQEFSIEWFEFEKLYISLDQMWNIFVLCDINLVTAVKWMKYYTLFKHLIIVKSAVWNIAQCTRTWIAVDDIRCHDTIGVNT